MPALRAILGVYCFQYDILRGHVPRLQAPLKKRDHGLYLQTAGPDGGGNISYIDPIKQLGTEGSYIVQIVDTFPSKGSHSGDMAKDAK